MTGIVVDSFAGGGGASLGIEMALGRPVDIAINHDREAVAMHQANHPHTRHYQQDIWQAKPEQVTRGRRVALAWFSPDCKHFSKAKGGKPVEKSIRDLAWVVIDWAREVRPDVIMLENVEEFRTWGPLGEDNRPHPDLKGQTFNEWLSQLRGLGYEVEWRELRACDYGAPTIRKRLFIIARCDGRAIRWPLPSHGTGFGLLPYRTAAECIDWWRECPSIFERARPLAEATMRRIANGIRRYVIEAAEPFIVGTAYKGANGSYINSVAEPMRVVLSQPDKALVTPFLAKHFGGNETPGAALGAPASTVTAKDHHALVTSNLVKLYGTNTGAPADSPMPTVTAGGGHVGEVRAFLAAYYGNERDGQAMVDPFRTVTSKERFGLVTVEGQPYEIVDIGMRMLAPRELFRAQGFPDGYIIDPVVDGRPLSKTAQIRMCGNSVCPPIARALVEANVVTEATRNLWRGYELGAVGGAS